jgi:hypothetical protein
MKTASALIVTLLSALPLASAHGFFSAMTIDGKQFKAPQVGGDKGGPSGIRHVDTQDPIKGANNKAINCGVNAQPAEMVLDAKPGSKVTVDWRAANGGKWPHNVGPMLTYMANCGDKTCDKFDPSNAEWFKIQQIGKKDDSKWVQEDLMNGGVASVTLPENIAPGNYMFRHEIIALHLANSKGGAEFYAGCAQLKIGGSGTGVPSKDELVKLPGAYSDNDPGIFVPDVFNPGSKYTFPGPPISKLAATSSPSTSPSKSSGGTCKLKNQAKAKVNVGATDSKYRPRHISRIMRDLKFDKH